MACGHLIIHLTLDLHFMEGPSSELAVEGFLGVEVVEESSAVGVGSVVGGKRVVAWGLRWSPHPFFPLPYEAVSE
jgi:hypothetical protein